MWYNENQRTRVLVFSRIQAERAAVILCDGKQIELSGGASDTTNNRMELMGLIQGLKALDKDTTSVKIYSDSQYVVRAFNDGWLKSWKRNGWKRKEGPVKNLDLWKELDKLTAQRKCTFIWVKGHNGNQYNELCDQMACAESAKYADGCGEEDDRPADILFSVDDILAALDEVLKEAQKGETIEECIRKNMPVVIVGDYDADGITSTTILTRLLYSMGVKVRPIIPRRFTDGYGVSDSILKGVENSLIITVDNGIAAGDVLDKAATEHGNTVVVLDHHLADGREPKRAAVICDPHMDGDSSPYKEYCGAGLAFKLAQYMLRVADISAMPDDLLVLACIGTIADSMPLTGDNRAIVMNGLRRVNSGEAHLPAGINQLLWTASSGAPMNEETIAYTVAPLINAPGRMYNAGGTSVLKALLCTDNSNAQAYLGKMVAINNDRKATVEEWMGKIRAAIDTQEKLSAPLVAFAKKMPEGIVGLVAGKLANQYHVPTIVLVETEDGIAKGSGRSYGDFDMKAMLDTLSDLLITYGGHVGAAGLSLMPDKVSEFRKRARDYCTGIEQAGEYIRYDIVLQSKDFGAAVQTLKKYQPFGQSVPKPVCMVRGFQALGMLEMGTNKTHIKLSGRNGNVVAFNMAEAFRSMGSPEVIDAVGSLGENTFRGETTVQFLADDIRAHI